MNVFSVDLELLGEMSQLPDSQKIFGALMYLFSKNELKTDEVSEFVRKIKEQETYFALSNILPKDFLPVPKTFIEYRAGDSAFSNNKTVYSALKKHDFAKENKIKLYAENPQENLMDETGDDYISLEIEQQVHINTEGVDEESGSQKNHIFSVQRTICKYNLKGHNMNEFQFYIRCEDDCKIIDLLKNNLNHIFTLGKRSSQGYNLFRLAGVQQADEIEKRYADKNNTYLNLGMLLPYSIVFTDEKSYLELYSSERRTFSSDHWNDKTDRGHFISFIAPGSIVVSNCIEKAGKCEPVPKKRSANGEIVFGNAFLLPWRI